MRLQLYLTLTMGLYFFQFSCKCDFLSLSWTLFLIWTSSCNYLLYRLYIYLFLHWG